MTLFDPRFRTAYMADYVKSCRTPQREYMTPMFNGSCCNMDAPKDERMGPYAFQSRTYYIPEVVLAVDKCGVASGYQPQRRNKGYALTVNDSIYNQTQLKGGDWPRYVFPQK